MRRGQWYSLISVVGWRLLSNYYKDNLCCWLKTCYMDNQGMWGRGDGNGPLTTAASRRLCRGTCARQVPLAVAEQSWFSDLRHWQRSVVESWYSDRDASSTGAWQRGDSDGSATSDTDRGLLLNPDTVLGMQVPPEHDKEVTVMVRRPSCCHKALSVV